MIRPKIMNYQKYLTIDQCRMIKVMGIETVMRDLCDYYESTINPDIAKNVLTVCLIKAYRKILHSHEKIRGGADDTQ